MSYTIGVNRCGIDQAENVYSGHSQVLDYFGNYILEPQLGESVHYVFLDKVAQEKNRKRFAFLDDADKVLIE